MAFDITQKRAAETAEIPLKNGDGSPMYGEDGKTQLTVTVHGPGSKVWKQAQADKNRKRAERMRKGGKMESALDNAAEDEIDFLTRVTVKFSAEIEHPDASNKKDIPRAIYADDALGFISDHVLAEVNNWDAFTKGSAKS